MPTLITCPYLLRWHAQEKKRKPDWMKRPPVPGGEKYTQVSHCLWLYEQGVDANVGAVVHACVLVRVSPHLTIL